MTQQRRRRLITAAAITLVLLLSPVALLIFASYRVHVHYHDKAIHCIGNQSQLILALTDDPELADAVCGDATSLPSIVDESGRERTVCPACGREYIVSRNRAAWASPFDYGLEPAVVCLGPHEDSDLVCYTLFDGSTRGVDAAWAGPRILEMLKTGDPPRQNFRGAPE